MFAAQRVANALQHLHAAVGCAGPKAGQAGHQGAGTGDVEAVDIFGRVDGFDHFVRIDVGWQWQLHQDAVDQGVAVQSFYPLQQVGFTQVGGQLLEHRVQTSLLAGLHFVAHIDLAGRVVAHQQHGQAGFHATRLQGHAVAGDLFAPVLGQGVAINDVG